MSLDMSPLYQTCVRQFSSQTGDTAFKADFIDAANCTFDELSNYAKLSSAISHIESTDEDVDDLDENHSVIVLSGLVNYLILRGRKHVRGDQSYVVAISDWEDKKSLFLQLMQEEDQATQDDDGVPSASIVGLGYVEDN